MERARRVIMERARTYLWVVLSGMVLAITAAAAGDGVKFPEPAYAKMPAIPSQQAMIVYRGGVETLIVESAFETESPSVGWVLPLPAEPSKLEVAEPGMLKSLNFCLRPMIIHNLSPFPWWLIISFVILVPVACVVISSQKEKMLIRLLVVMPSVLLFFLVALVPITTSGTSYDALGISLKQFRRIGNYDVSVLRADNADALSEWLARNSLKTLSNEQKPVVEDYISRKWCFVVARLRREGGHSARPHPISATFPTEVPIYPMKLTALAGSTTRVDLFIVADMRAAADGFECIVSDTFTLDRPKSYPREDIEDQPHPYYSGRDTELVVGSPDAGELMWQGCILTKLSADLAPSDMDRDIRIELVEPKSHQQRVYSALGRRAMVIRVLLGGSLFVLIGLMIVYREQRIATAQQLCAILAIAVVILIAAGVTYKAIPVVPTGTYLHPSSDRMRVRTQLNAIGLLTSKVGAEAKMPDSGLVNLPQMMRECVPRRYYRNFTINNPITGEVMRYERSGGNFSARRVDGKLYICFYSLDGREYRTLSPFQGLLPEEKRDKK